jgi:hypothetical protein
MSWLRAVWRFVTYWSWLDYAFVALIIYMVWPR